MLRRAQTIAIDVIFSICRAKINVAANGVAVDVILQIQRTMIHVAAQTIAIEVVPERFGTGPIVNDSERSC